MVAVASSSSFFHIVCLVFHQSMLRHLPPNLTDFVIFLLIRLLLCHHACHAYSSFSTDYYFVVALLLHRLLTYTVASFSCSCCHVVNLSLPDCHLSRHPLDVTATPSFSYCCVSSYCYCWHGAVFLLPQLLFCIPPIAPTAATPSSSSFC